MRFSTRSLYIRAVFLVEQPFSQENRAPRTGTSVMHKSNVMFASSLVFRPVGSLLLYRLRSAYVTKELWIMYMMIGTTTGMMLNTGAQPMHSVQQQHPHMDRSCVQDLDCRVLNRLRSCLLNSSAGSSRRTFFFCGPTRA